MFLWCLIIRLTHAFTFRIIKWSLILTVWRGRRAKRGKRGRWGKNSSKQKTIKKAERKGRDNSKTALRKRRSAEEKQDPNVWNIIPNPGTQSITTEQQRKA